MCINLIKTGGNLNSASKMAHATSNPSRYPIAFQIWKNGDWQKSATHTSDCFHESGETHFQVFCDCHAAYAASGQTTARLVICNNDAEEREELAHYFEN